MLNLISTSTSIPLCSIVIYKGSIVIAQELKTRVIRVRLLFSMTEGVPVKFRYLFTTLCPKNHVTLSE